MPEYDDTTVTQTIPRSSPRPRRVDQSRERYPRDGSVEEVYVEQRQFLRDNQHPKGHLAIRREELTRRPRPQSERPRRQEARRSEDHYDSEDSDSEYRRSRRICKRNSSHRLKVTPCSDKYADNPPNPRSRSTTRHHYHSKSRSSSSDSGYSSATSQRKHRNRKLLYTGLACVTTVAAANNIYQNTKAHHARQNHVREGGMRTPEAKRLKSKALMMDLLTVGVVAVGINNARMGWKKVEDVVKEGK